jgi:hypothetical protein
VTKVLTVQPSSYTDYITSDGQALSRKPYPFHVRADRSGEILRQDIWRGSPVRAVGFVGDPSRHEVDLFWLQRSFLADPQQAVGMYLVTQDSDGKMAVHITAVEKIEETEVEDA